MLSTQLIILDYSAVQLVVSNIVNPSFLCKAFPGNPNVWVWIVWVWIVWKHAPPHQQFFFRFYLLPIPN